jgi:putative acetyltransferase
MIILKPTDPRHSDVKSLLAQSDRLMLSLYPPASNHLDPPETLAGDHVLFLGAYDDSALVGCGAVKLMQDDGCYGEIKRVFVVPAARGAGIATSIMRELEAHLLAHGVSLARLETGIHQPEAINFYHRSGYADRGPFGAYRPDPLSIFMEKKIA